MDWTEIQVKVDTGSVEAVANMIHESGAGGVVIEHINSQFSIVTAYIPVGEETEAILAKLEEFLLILADMDVSAQATVNTKIVAEQDWAEEWKKHYHPVQVGKVYITPSWLEHTAAQGEITVELDPGMAFGTGIHPTTQMCISELCTSISGQEQVLDLGSGSGILSIVAAKLGASSVQAVDNDRVAVEVAEENAKRNNCEIEQIKGDAFTIFKDTNHDVVVANIGFNACAALRDIFIQENKQAVLILSGFPAERLNELVDCVGDKIIRTQTKEDWGCAVLGPK